MRWFDDLAPHPLWSDQATGALVPMPSVEASSQEIYSREAYDVVVVGANFTPDTKLVFDPPLHEHEELGCHVRRTHSFFLMSNLLFMWTPASNRIIPGIASTFLVCVCCAVSLRYIYSYRCV